MEFGNLKLSIIPTGNFIWSHSDDGWGYHYIPVIETAKFMQISLSTWNVFTTTYEGFYTTPVSKSVSVDIWKSVCINGDMC